MSVQVIDSSEGTGISELDKIIAVAGYSYDPQQDIFYSTMDPWQRNIGYCRLYDEAAALMGMIIDCEPIQFEYLDKKWMIGLWKGQYDLVTGGEIGIYTDGVEVDILGIFSGIYYNCASNTDRLQMSYTLKKNNTPLFTREGKHWWLTGFKLGEFSEPSELTMDIGITLHNVQMRDAFLNGLWNAGYSLDEFERNGSTISFTYKTPHTPPPRTRTPALDRIVQWKNKLLCNKFQAITGGSKNIEEKIIFLKEHAPDMYNKFTNQGKANEFLYKLLLSGINSPNNASIK